MSGGAPTRPDVREEVDLTERQAPRPGSTEPRKVVVSGVSGTGKNVVGRLLAERIGLAFLDADDFHPTANIHKMSAGVVLTDDDRWEWLDTVGRQLQATDDVVLACSALRRSHHDRLSLAVPSLFFVQLVAQREVLELWLQSREDHFMPASLLGSQLQALEPLDGDELGVVVQTGPNEVTRQVDRLLARLGPAADSPSSQPSPTEDQDTNSYTHFEGTDLTPGLATVGQSRPVTSLSPASPGSSAP